jgi:hypothetical protein
MRIIRNAEEGRKLLLERRPLAIDELPMEMREMTFRAFGQELSPDEVVRRVIRDVREDGDNAVRFYNSLFDAASADDLRVTDAEIRAAYDEVDAEVVEALKFAAERVRRYHELQLDGRFQPERPGPDAARDSACGGLRAGHTRTVAEHGVDVRHSCPRCRRR